MPTTSPPISSTSQTRTLQAIFDHHAQLETAVAAGAVAVRDAAERLMDVAPHRDALVRTLERDVLPHAAAEERTLYAVAGELPTTQLLVRAMTAEHRRLEGLVAELTRSRTPVSSASAAIAVRVLFEAHLAKENDDLLPALVDADVDLGQLLEGMHEILGGDEALGTDAAASGGCGCGGCGCGDDSSAVDQVDVTDGAGLRTTDLDVRSMLPALRHERIFATVADLAVGESFVLCNDHDPKPLRYQLDAEQPGEIAWDYLDQGPAVWRVRIGRLPVA